MHLNTSNQTFDIDPTTLKIAGDLYVYLNFCPDSIIDAMMRLELEEFLNVTCIVEKKPSLDLVLIFLNRLYLTTKGKDSELNRVVTSIIEILKEEKKLKLKFKRMDQFAQGNKIADRYSGQ